MAKYYPANYYSFTPKRRPLLNNFFYKQVRRLQDHFTVFPRGFLGRLIHTYMPNKKLHALSHIHLDKHSRILDIGCGDGWRLFALREIGFKNVLGVDLFIGRSIEYPNGVKVKKQSIHEVEGEWDVVMFHHSFEHMPDPLETLTSASQILSSGGCCLIRIPTSSSYAWNHYRENWFQIDAPRHFFLHSLRSLELLAERAGFRVREILFDSTLDQFVKSEEYLSINSGQAQYAANSEKKRQWKRQAALLNSEGRGDQAAFFLEKVS